MKGLDLRKFKKLHSNEHTTTMQHPDGHQIKIAHAKLKPDMKKQLADLPKFSQGGEVHKYWQGTGNVVPDTQDLLNTKFEEQNPNETKYKEYRDFLDKNQPGLPESERERQALEYTTGAKEQKDQQAMQVSQSAQSNVAQQSQLNEQRAKLGLPTKDTMPGSNVPAQMPGDMNVLPDKELSGPPAPDAQNPAMQAGFSPINALSNSADEQAKAMYGIANVQGQQAKNELAASQQHQKAMAQMQADFQKHADGIGQEISKITADYNAGHIDPQHFFSSKSDIGKMSTVIGVILGGLGSGLTGGPNVALDFLNKQIDRDIEGQKAEMGKKHNMISALQQQFGNLKDATVMAKAIQADIFSSKLNAAALKSGDAMAQAKAKLFDTQIHAQLAPQVADMALKQSVLQGYQKGSYSAAQVAPVIFTEPGERARALEEVKDRELRDNAVKEIKHTMGQLAALQTIGSRVGSPLQSTSQIESANLKINSLAKELFGKVSDSEIDQIKHGAQIKFRDSQTTIDRKTKDLTDAIYKHESSPTLDSRGLSRPRPVTSFSKRGR